MCIQRHFRASRDLCTSSPGKMAAKIEGFWEDGLIFPSRAMAAQRSKFASIVHSFWMSYSKSGSLTSKDGCIISLTPGDL